MDKERILVVEDDNQTAHYLKIYFDWLGYEVLIANRGAEAIETSRLKTPNIIILDVTLPDMTGYEVCRALRDGGRTNQIPVIFISQRSRRNDIIAAFELGADDYVTKPFDIEELRLRAEGVIRRSKYESYLHPITRLPAGELIVDQLRRVKDSAESWALLYFSLENFEAWREKHPEKVSQSLILLADTLRETVDAHGTPNDFIGQASDDSFVVITIPETATSICQTVIDQFHRDNEDSIKPEQADDSLRLLVGAVSSYDGPFTDIKQIAKTLAQSGFKSQEAGCPETLSGIQWRAEDIDYANQLAEQVSLWHTAPELAQALIEVERLTAARVPDMDKVGGLLGAAADIELPEKLLERLKAQQRRCLLAAENLSWLQYKIRNYQEFQPASLIGTIGSTLTLLEKRSQINLSSVTKTISELRIALPQLRLEQAIHNVCRWLLDGDDAARVDISLEVTKDAASLIFTLAGTARELPSVSTLLEDLNQNKPEAVYGYLAQKIAARYGGGLASEQDRMVLILPLAEGDEISITKENIEALQQRIKEQRLFLDAKKRITFSPQVPDVATTLMNPLVEDLLANIEGMLTLLSQSPGLDLQNYPWSAIQRNYRFFRLLALDLQKDRPIIPAPVNLKSLLESLEPMLMPRMLDHEIIIESDIPRPVINSDQMRLSQIFVNLALNALEAMPDGGTLKFHLKQDHRHAIVEVIDDGVGISPEDQPHIFSAHFTTKSSDHGGAGLHRVKKYLEQLNGQIEVYSKLGEGTRLAVKLPLNWESGYF